jgi:hypothetical protein
MAPRERAKRRCAAGRDGRQIALAKVAKQFGGGLLAVHLGKGQRKVRQRRGGERRLVAVQPVGERKVALTGNRERM